ncbi:nose resistant to fluoxetine protein 6-like [Branchiostoma floridae x Branchiostoma japonicum]
MPRLTPVYAFLLMVFTCLMEYMGSGPWWAIRGDFTMSTVQVCRKYWWANLLYINNYVGYKCFPHAWYLGVDMQLYVTLTGLLVVLYRYPKVGVAVACFLIGSTWLLNGVLHYFLVDVNFYRFTTWSFTRMDSYLIGILLGYLLFRTDRKVPDTPNTRKLMLLGWIVGTTCALVALVTPFGAPEANLPFGAPEANLLGHAAWRTFERSLFAAGVAWVVYACCVGYGGIISEFLSWSGWLPLSRLSYTAYLVHPIIIQAYYMDYKGPWLYSAVTWWFMFVSFSFMSLVCGFAASMMAEVPFLELEKILLPKRRGRETKYETTAEDGHDSMAMKAVECDPDPPLPPHDGKGTSGPNGC